MLVFAAITLARPPVSWDLLNGLYAIDTCFAL